MKWLLLLFGSFFELVEISVQTSNQNTHTVRFFSLHCCRTPFFLLAGDALGCKSCGYYVLLVRVFFSPCATRKMKLKKKINHHFFPVFLRAFFFCHCCSLLYFVDRTHSACVLERIFNFMAKGSISCFTDERMNEIERDDAMAWEVN